MRLVLVTFLCVAASLWGLLVLYAQYVQLDHAMLITNIRAGSNFSDKQTLKKAIADYDRVIAVLPCNAPLYQDLLLLTAHSADMAMAEPYAEDVGFYLEKTLETLSALLSCTPHDGKVWLDFATINNYYEGFTGRSLEAYKMSQRVTPSESWLAEKRIIFALKFQPFLDTEALAAVRSDLETLGRGAGFRMPNILKLSGLKSKEELEKFFFGARPVTPQSLGESVGGDKNSSIA